MILIQLNVDDFLLFYSVYDTLEEIYVTRRLFEKGKTYEPATFNIYFQHHKTNRYFRVEVYHTLDDVLKDER